jgi:hypothetical protein
MRNGLLVTEVALFLMKNHPNFELSDAEINTLP